MNFLLYWIIFLKTEMKRSKAWDNYSKVFLFLVIIPLYSIPILSSRIFTLIFGTPYYFHDQWPIFIILGIILVGMAIKIGSLALEQNKIRGLAKGNYQLLTGGIYGILRHPMYTAQLLGYVGVSFIFDSMYAIILIPIIIICFGIEAYVEETKLLIPKFGDNYIMYKNNNPSRLFPEPYNYFVYLIGIFVVYIGILNFELIFSA